MSSDAEGTANGEASAFMTAQTVLLAGMDVKRIEALHEMITLDTKILFYLMAWMPLLAIPCSLIHYTDGDGCR